MKASNIFRNLSAVLVLSLLLTQTPVTFAEGPASLELSPELKTEFDRGLAAAKANDFTLAKSYFSKVQEKALLYPPLLFNLGLADAHAGNALAAICWFEAYLLLDPQAQNREEIRKEITRLTGEATVKAMTIFAETQKAAESIQGTDPYNRQAAFTYLAEVYTSGGDSEAAAKALSFDVSITDPAKQLKDYKNYEMITLARLGEIEAAEKIASEIDWATTESVTASIAFEAAAKGKLERGDVMGGWALMRQIPAKLRENSTWPFIARFVKEKDFVPVEQLIQEAGEKAGEGIFALAQHKIESGDLAGAKALAQYYTSPVYKARFQLRLADQLFRKGDRKGAKRIAEEVASRESERVGDPANEYWAEDFIVDILALKGEFEKAFRAAEKMTLSVFSPSKQPGGFSTIILYSVLAGEEKKARDFLKRALAYKEGSFADLLPYQGYAEALKIQGRIPEAIAMIGQIDDGYWDRKSERLMEIADQYLAKGDQEGAIQTLLKGTELPSVVPSFTVQLAETLIGAGRFEEALDAAQKGYSKQAKTRIYIEDAKQIEKMMRLRVQAEQEKKGVDPRAIDWVLLARLLSDFFNVDADIKNVPIQRASQPDSPEVLVLDTALVAQNIKNSLFIIENVRKGKKAYCAYPISQQTLT